MTFTITWLGQGGYLFDIGEKRLCVDPYLSDAVFAAEGLRRMPPVPIDPKDLRADLIVCTHDHIDHLDEETLRRVEDPLTRFAGPDSCLDHLERLGIPSEKRIRLRQDDMTGLGDAEIHGVFADHTPDSIGLVIRAFGSSVYLTGDSLYQERLTEVKTFRPDLLIVCVNGKWGNMNIPDAARLTEKVEVKAAIPSHYGMFAENTADPGDFERALAGSGIACRIMELGKTYRVAELIHS